MAKATPKKAAPKKAEAKAPKKAAAKSTGKAAGKKQEGQANAGLMQPLTVSADLAKVVGKEPLPRTQIIKKMWDYIKANDLQDKDNRRMINADKNLKVVFDGKDQVSMFELAKVINNHVKK
ncbi:MAG: SWIB/MDM2 domain-containing protein [Bacteroidota bacterium]|nr:SWIB/MDM2 domain-containing protein [Bacteroidota bacterium]